MAFDKKVLFLNDGKVIAVKYDMDNQLCTIGGHKSTMETLTILLTDYFGLDSGSSKFPELRMSTRNKCRYTFDCAPDLYTNVCHQLKEDDQVLEDVNNHGSIMR